MQGTIRTDEGRPVESAELRIVGTDLTATTDREGGFVIRAVPVGERVLRVSVLGYRDARETLRVRPGETVRVDLALETLAVELSGVRVSVLRPDLQPESRLQEEEVREANPRDVAEALETLPGVDAVRRGPLGQDPVVRGLRETQVGAYVDGTRSFPAGPGRMDSPLTHLDPSAIQEVEVVKGPYALTWGAGNLAAVRVETRAVPPQVPGALRGRFLTGYDSNLGAQEYAGSLFGSSGRVAYWLHGVWRGGDDYEDGAGNAVPADFESWETRGKLGIRTGDASWLTLSAGWQEQGPIDYPGRLLTADFFETLNLSARWQLQRNDGFLRSVEILAYNNDVDHGMTNAGKPTAEPNPDRMPPFALDVDVNTGAETRGGRLGVTLAPDDLWTVEVGGDVYSVNRDAVRTIRRQDNQMLLFQDLMWPDATVTDAGLWTRVARPLGSRVSISVAGRVDFVGADADTISDFFADNAGTDLEATETHLSGAVTLSTRLDSNWSLSGGLGTAVRTADASERYSDRIPSTKAQMSNEFMGNPGLDPERSTQVDVWLEGRYPRVSVSLNAFWRSVDDYVTVEATDLPRRLPLSPPTVFQYVNGAANFRGAEGSVAVALTRALTGTLTAGWLRGEDESFDEPAIGVAPLEGSLSLRWEPPRGPVFAEGTFNAVDRQERVASTRGETETAGYATVDLQTGVQVAPGALVRLSVVNAFDRAYVSHLASKNPFTGLQVAEPGRVVSLRLSYAF